MELVTGGDLFTRIEDGKSLNEKEAKKYIF
jgi:hypothetical protein